MKRTFAVLIVVWGCAAGVRAERASAAEVFVSEGQVFDLLQDIKDVYLPIPHPDVDSRYLHRVGPLPMDFFDAAWSEAIVKNAYAVMRPVGNNAIALPVYELFAFEDVNGDFVVHNMYDVEIFRAANPGYDPYAWAKQYFEVGSTAELTQMQRLYHPDYKVGLRLELIPEAFYEAWREEQQAELLAVQSVETLAMPMMMSMASSSDELTLSIGSDSNATVEVKITWPTGFSNNVDLFATTDLVEPEWSLAMGNIPTLGNVNEVWTDPDVDQHKTRFFLAADDYDSDSDDLSDARETMLHGTVANDPDSDDDGILDGDEVSASGVADNDGYLTDPLRPDTADYLFPTLPASGPSVSLTGLNAFDPPASNTVFPNIGTPEIAEWTRINNPGDTMALTGEALSAVTGTGAGRDTRFLFFGESEGGKVLADGEIRLLDERQCAVTLPEALPADTMYLMWPRNENGYGQPVAINQTDAWWIGPDVVSTGEAFSVYGRNLQLGNDPVYAYLDGYGWITNTTANPYKADFTVPDDISTGTYSLYTHNGHGGEHGWSDPIDLIIADPPNWNDDTNTWINVKDYGAYGNGISNDFDAIEVALDAVTPASNTVFFPEGMYAIHQRFSDQLREKRVIGAGMEVTSIVLHPSENEYNFIRGHVSGSKFKDLTFAALNGGKSEFKMMLINGTENAIFDSVRFSHEFYTQPNGDLLYAGEGSHHLTFTNCEFIAADNMFFGDADTRQIFFDGCRFVGMHDLNTAITANANEFSLINSSFRNYDNSNPTNGYGWAKGRWLAGQGKGQHSQESNPMLWYFGGNTTTNLCPRRTAIRATASLVSFNTNDAVVSDASGFKVKDRMRILTGLSIGNTAEVTGVDNTNKIVTINKGWLTDWGFDPKVGDLIGAEDNVDRNSGEIIFAESLPALVRENPVGVLSNMVMISTIPVYTNKVVGIPTAFTNLADHVVAVVEGRGQGQTRRIDSWSGSTLMLSKPWKVVPDTNSVIILGECAYRMVVYDNYFDGTENSIDPGWDSASTGVEPYGMSCDWIVDSNTFDSLRQGIAEFAWVEHLQSDTNSPLAVTPNYFNYYANNDITNCYQGIQRSLRNKPKGTGEFIDPLVIGTIYRSNIVVGSVEAAVDCAIEISDHSTDNFIELTVFDQNNISDSDDMFVGREGFFNQLWVGNSLEGIETGLNMTSNHVPVLHNNSWSGFATNYAGATPGGVFGLPLRMIPALGVTNTIPVRNSGTDELDWTASESSSWITLINTNGTVLDENDEDPLAFVINTNSMSGEAVITFTGNTQTQEVTIVVE